MPDSQGASQENEVVEQEEQDGSFHKIVAGTAPTGDLTTEVIAPRLSTDPVVTTTFNPMELPANPAARAQFPEHLINKDPNAPFTSSPIGGEPDEERLEAALHAREAFPQPEPADYEQPHLARAQKIVDDRQTAIEDAEPFGHVIEEHAEEEQPVEDPSAPGV